MNKNRARRFLHFLLFFTLSFCVCLFLTAAYIQNKCALEYIQMEHMVLTNAKKVEDVITKLLYRTQTLSALVIQNNGAIADFDRVAATIIDDPAIRNVIVAPNGVVTHVFPAEGNEAAFGFDYFSESAGNKEAMAAKETGQLVLGGPFELVQGGQALVGRLPVYLGEDKAFWGIVSVTLNYPDALTGANLSELENHGFAFEIWRVNPDDGQRQTIAYSPGLHHNSTHYVERRLQILNAEWYFRLSPIRLWYELPETWILSVASLVVSLLLALLVLHNQDLRQMHLELEALTYRDPLTGILNRRGVFQRFEEMLSHKPAHFTLCYMDLNKFKRINDAYGHTIGDRVLQQFASTLQKQSTSQHIFARIGGDEFLFLFKNTENDAQVRAFFERAQQTLTEQPLVFQSCKIHIGFSVGIAVYPQHGQTIDELIAYADLAMYQDKAVRDGGSAPDHES